MDMAKIVGATISIAVSVIVLATVLAPTIAEYTATDGSLAKYSSLLGAILVMCIVGILMVAVRLISDRNRSGTPARHPNTAARADRGHFTIHVRSPGAEYPAVVADNGHGLETEKPPDGVRIEPRMDGIISDGLSGDE